MKTLTKNALLFSLGLGAIGFACQPQEDLNANYPVSEDIPGHVLTQLNALGFDINEVLAVEDGYLVERDIFMTESEIMSMAPAVNVNAEHYHTTNTVSTPRTINLYVNMPTKYEDATDIVVSRYNALNLDLTFARVTSSASADITIQASPWYYGFFGILGSAGFPDASGNPYNTVLMTRSYYDNVSNINGLATTIAHEVGHCIGFRHTDYMDRSYSCGGAADNEGASDVGAVYIPGTPSGPSANSWMLACGSPELDRPFTTADQTALTTLY